MNYKKRRNQRKSLRQKYMADPKAKEFLEKHPEFDNAFIEQVERNYPGFDNNRGSYALVEANAERKALAANIQQAMRYMPNSKKKRLLELYFGGLPYRRLMELTGFKNKATTYWAIHEAKAFALRFLEATKHVKIGAAAPLAIKSFNRNGTTKLCFLTTVKGSEEPLWVLEDGTVLNDEIQEILDTHKDFKSWDEVWL